MEREYFCLNCGHIYGYTHGEGYQPGGPDLYRVPNCPVCSLNVSHSVAKDDGDYGSVRLWKHSKRTMREDERSN